MHYFLGWYHYLSRVAPLGRDGLAVELVSREDQSNNQTIQTQSFRENENEDDTNEEFLLTGICTNAGITDDTDGDTCRQTSHTTAKSGSKGSISTVRRVSVRCLID